MKKGILYTSIAVLIVIAGILLMLRSKDQTQFDSASAPAVSVPAGLTQTYSDPDLHFSLAYPDAFTYEVSGDASARLILFTNNAGGQEFQLYVTKFDGAAGSVTADLIKTQIPGLDMRDPRPVSFSGGGQGVSFLSTRDGVRGDVREVWFAEGGHFFQWSAPVDSEPAMQAAISTLINQ